MSSLKKIAMETQLAEATVSRILRQRDQCSPQTRRRVLEAAKRLRYRPNMLVRGMQTGRTMTVGVMLPLASEFFGKVFSGVHDALVQADQVPIVLWCRDQFAKPGIETERGPELSELTQIYRLLDRRVDGVILRPVDDAIDDAYLREVWERRIPMVAVNRELEHTHADFVGCDDHAIGRLAAEHLLALGHRRLGHVAGPDCVTTARRRREGFERAVQDAGLHCQTVVDRHYGIARRPIAELLRSPDRPSALFAVNDEVAANVYDVARDLSLAIPRDLSVIGCANMTLGARLHPSLTTFEEHPYAAGRKAVELLLARQRRPDLAPQKLRLQPELIVRQSTAEPSPSSR